MVWTKLSDKFPRGPRVAGLSDAAFRAHVTALCFCNEQTTNGEVSLGAAKTLGIPPRVARELVASGLWEVIGTDSGEQSGWLLTDFFVDQRHRDVVEDERRKRHEAKVRGGQTRAAGAKRVGGRFAPADQQDTSSGASDALVPADQQRTSPVPEPVPEREYVSTSGRDRGSRRTSRDSYSEQLARLQRQMDLPEGVG